LRPLADRILLSLAALLAAALTGCAQAPTTSSATPALFAVVPGSDGHVGAIVVEREGQRQVVDTAYGARTEGTQSKLTTWGDGFRILGTILRLHMLERPMAFYLTLALAGFFVSLGLGVPVIIEYLQTGLVPRFPTAIAAVGFMMAALLCAAVAIILDSAVTGRREAKRLVYLGIPATRDKG